MFLEPRDWTVFEL